MTDVIVIGGGPAGASAAANLARRGRSVVLLERQPFPRRKACGEGILPAGVAELRRMGLLERIACRGQALRGVRFCAGPHEALAPLGRSRGAGLGITRSVLDQCLLQEAREAGVDVREGSARRLLVRDGQVAGVQAEDGAVRAGAVIAADGLQSRLRRLAALEGPHGDRYGVSAHIALRDGPPPHVVVVRFLSGYEVYLTPLPGNTWNAAILTRRPGMTRFAGSIAPAFREILSWCPEAKGAELVDEPLAAGPFPRACLRAWRANLVLAGDAAGFFDGISGEGISLAMLSGRLAAEAVDAFLETGSYAPMRLYDARRRAAARNSNLVARLTLALSSRPWLAERAVAQLARHPATFARLVAVNTGELPLRALNARDLTNLLLG
jgi:flavin-dependent dehydrogenase